jgi:glycosyltransferase involved in cell wall biosynthesis
MRALEQLAVLLGVNDNVTWAGHVSGAAKSDLLQRANAFVLPSINENFGIAPVEALAAGLPVVLTRGVAIHREVAQQQAGIIADDNAHSLADAMLQMRVPATHQMMSDRAMELARSTFSIEAMQRGLVAMYKAVLAA